MQRALCSLIFTAAAVISAAAAAEGEVPPVSFIRDVAPVLVAKCRACHGPKTAESNYRLDTFKSLMESGDFGSAPITAGVLDESEVHRLITAEDAEERMPNNGDRLADAEIAAIATWIRQGAVFDGQDPNAPLRDQIPRDLPHPAAPITYPMAFPVSAMAFTSDGNQLLVGGYHELLIWDPAAGTLVARVGNIPQRTLGMAFSPDGSCLAVAGGSPGVSGEVRMIPWAAGPKPDAKPMILTTQEDVFFDVAFRPDGQQLVAGGADGLVRVFDATSGVERLKIEGHADWVTDVGFSADGKYIAAASRDKTAKVFDAESGALVATYSEHNAPVRAISFAADGKRVISAGGSRVHIWNVEDSKMVSEFSGFGNDVYALLASGEFAVAASADGSARYFKMADQSVIHSFTEHPTWILSLAWHEPTHRISTGCFDGAVTVWDLEKGTMVKQFLATPAGAAPAN